MTNSSKQDDRYKETFLNKKVMVTGGLGFIGSNLARILVSLGSDVLLVDCLIPEHGGNIHNILGIDKKVTINIADLRDANSMNHLVKGVDYIFNLAGQISHMDSMTNPLFDLEVNIRAHLILLEACRKNNSDVKIIYTGTRQIYGKPLYLPVDEQHPIRPIDINGVNKYAGEWYHIVYHEAYGMRTASLRLTNTYGPRMLMMHNRGGFVSWFIRQALDNEEITIFGDGKQTRDFNYVDDVCEALLKAGASEDVNGQIFNLGGNERLSLIDFTKLLIDICKSGSYRLVPFPSERKKIDIEDYYGTFSKIRTILGWEPKITLEDGLRRTIDFYNINKAHYW